MHGRVNVNNHAVLSPSGCVRKLQESQQISVLKRASESIQSRFRVESLSSVPEESYQGSI